MSNAKRVTKDNQQKSRISCRCRDKETTGRLLNMTNHVEKEHHIEFKKTFGLQNTEQSKRT